MSEPIDDYKKNIEQRVESYQNDSTLKDTSSSFVTALSKTKYAYNFFWLGVPILQIPQDLQALQEIIWETKPDLIIETGVAWGGSIVFSASMLAILESCGNIKNGTVIGIDIDIRAHNRKEIENHPLAHKIKLIESSSVSEETISQVISLAKGKKVLVCLDSNHTHDHVLQELRAYAPLVSNGGYCIVGDTGVEDLPEGTTLDRPWGKGNNPKTAVWQYLKENKNFVVDKNLENKLILTGSPDGYLKRINP